LTFCRWLLPLSISSPSISLNTPPTRTAEDAAEKATTAAEAAASSCRLGKLQRCLWLFKWPKMQPVHCQKLAKVTQQYLSQYFNNNIKKYNCGFVALFYPN